MHPHKKHSVFFKKKRVTWHAACGIFHANLLRRKLFTTLDKPSLMCYIVPMKNENTKHRTQPLKSFDPDNPSHWISHNEWLKITERGAPRPNGSSAFWNDWAKNNPQSQAIGLSKFDALSSLKSSLLNPRGILGSAARPVDL